MSLSSDYNWNLNWKPIQAQIIDSHLLKKINAIHKSGKWFKYMLSAPHSQWRKLYSQ